MAMSAHWKFCAVLFLIVGLLAGFAGVAAATTASEKAKTASGAKPSQSDILTCDDFNTDFAQLAAETSFGDVNVLQLINDGVKAKNPTIRQAVRQLAVQLSDQALRSGAPTQTYELDPLTWALFRDFYAVGAACNRFRIGPL
jgi:curli biogenesis system outer membrane secretion channel CsgG